MAGGKIDNSAGGGRRRGSWDQYPQRPGKAVRGFVSLDETGSGPGGIRRRGRSTDKKERRPKSLEETSCRSTRSFTRGGLKEDEKEKELSFCREEKRGEEGGADLLRF